MWIPVLHVRINNPARHSPPTSRFEAIVDSGAPECYFHGDIAKAIGIRVEDGIESSIGGIVGGVKIPIYYHSVGLYVGVDILKIKAGFSNQLSVAAILSLDLNRMDRQKIWSPMTQAVDKANSSGWWQDRRTSRGKWPE